MMTGSSAQRSRLARRAGRDVFDHPYTYAARRTTARAAQPRHHIHGGSHELRPRDRRDSRLPGRHLEGRPGALRDRLLCPAPHGQQGARPVHQLRRHDRHQRGPTGSSVAATIDLPSIDTGNEPRDNHLRSADYFEVEKYPTMSYRSAGMVNGFGPDLWGGQRAGFSATAQINRRDFGIGISIPMDGGGV